MKVISEKEFEKELFQLIGDLRDKKIDSKQFANQARALIKKIPKQMRDFEDEDLGWAKYWIEEMSYYGIDFVLANRFDYIAFLAERQIARLAGEARRRYHKQRKRI